jgi:hypothetical protein
MDTSTSEMDVSTQELEMEMVKEEEKERAHNKFVRSQSLSVEQRTVQLLRQHIDNCTRTIPQR